MSLKASGYVSSGMALTTARRAPERKVRPVAELVGRSGRFDELECVLREWRRSGPMVGFGFLDQMLVLVAQRVRLGDQLLLLGRARVNLCQAALEQAPFLEDVAGEPLVGHSSRCSARAGPRISRRA